MHCSGPSAPKQTQGDRKLSVKSPVPSVPLQVAKAGPRRPRNDRLYRAADGFVRSRLKERSRTTFEAAISGDVTAAELLLFGLPRSLIGVAVMAGYYGGMPGPAYRALLREVWSLAHGSILEAANHDYALVRRLFRSGDFEVPLKGRVDIYRGAYDVGVETAALGISWTTNRDVACFFAYQYAQPRPIVVTATVDASEIVYFDDARSECEVILRRPVRAVIDPDCDSWKGAAARQGAQNWTNSMALLAPKE